MLAKFDWEYHGTLDNISSTNNKGVYLLVHRGVPNRIIYVGTTNCFNRRLKQHKHGLLEGNRPVWRIGADEDIYELMSYQGVGGRASMFKYYASLAKKGKLWASTTLDKIDIKNDLLKKDNFEVNWKSYVENSYIKCIDIWTCSIFGSDEKMIQLESQIQRAFKKNFMIGSHIHNTGMCWLGKIEYLGEIYDYTFRFKRYPDLDPDSIALLKNLTDTKVIKYFKQSYIEKERLKKEKLELLKSKYKYAGDPWHAKENDFIYFCCNLGVSAEDIAIKLLRSPDEVKKRIKYLSRYYDMSKQQ